MNKSKKIYILTNFSMYLKSFSPIIVVQSQLEMLKRAGYDPILITNKGWNPPESSIFMQVENKQLTPVDIEGKVVDEKFERQVDQLYEEMRGIIEDDSVVITHDLIFLPDHVKHNVAARRLAVENPTVFWLHWIHSATGPQTLIQERSMFGEQYMRHLLSKFPNSMICYPNSYNIPRVALNFSFEENEVVEVPHATDPVEGLSPLVQRLYYAKDLSSKEVLMVYPLRLDRGKQPELNVRLIAACKQIGLSAALVFADFQSTGDDKVKLRDECKALASRLGVQDDIIFMSEFDESAKMEISHQAVLDLLTLSNIFMLPSKSETYSLVAQEAMLKGNLCILNHDFMPMRQIYGDNALYRQFSSNIGFDGNDGTITTTYKDTDEYFRQIATNVKYWLEHDRVLRAKTWVRTQRNPDYIFREYVEPLLYMEPTEMLLAKAADSQPLEGELVNA